VKLLKRLLNGSSGVFSKVHAISSPVRIARDTTAISVTIPAILNSLLMVSRPQYLYFDRSLPSRPATRGSHHLREGGVEVLLHSRPNSTVPIPTSTIVRMMMPTHPEPASS
jgi:hypothetical protein